METTISYILTFLHLFYTHLLSSDPLDQAKLIVIKNSFVEIETKKRKETEEKESKKSSSKDKTKSPTSSTKKRLLELKGLFDEELISKNEYETKRKKILENL